MVHLSSKEKDPIPFLRQVHQPLFDPSSWYRKKKVGVGRLRFPENPSWKIICYWGAEIMGEHPQGYTGMQLPRALQ